MVEDFDIVDLAGSNHHQGWYTAPQIQKGVQFDRRLGFPKTGPREERQAKIDGGGIQGVDRLIQFQAKTFAGVKLSGVLDQHLSEVGVDAPVPCFVGMGQVVARYSAPDAQVIKLGLVGSQTGLDIPETFSICKLGKSQAEKLVPTRKSLHLVVPPVAFYALLEIVSRQVDPLIEKKSFSLSS